MVCLLLLILSLLLVKVVSIRILGCRGGVPPFIPACNDNWVGVVILLLLFSFDSEPSVSTSSIVPPPLLLPLLPVKLLRDIRLRILVNFLDIIVFFTLLLFDDDNGVLLVLLGVPPLKSGDEDDFFISFVGCGGGVSGYTIVDLMDGDGDAPRVVDDVDEFALLLLLFELATVVLQVAVVALFLFLIGEGDNERKFAARSAIFFYTLFFTLQI